MSHGKKSFGYSWAAASIVIVVGFGSVAFGSVGEMWWQI